MSFSKRTVGVEGLGGFRSTPFCIPASPGALGKGGYQEAVGDGAFFILGGSWKAPKRRVEVVRGQWPIFRGQDSGRMNLEGTGCLRAYSALSLGVGNEARKEASRVAQC